VLMPTASNFSEAAWRTFCEKLRNFGCLLRHFCHSVCLSEDEDRWVVVHLCDTENFTKTSQHVPSFYWNLTLVTSHIFIWLRILLEKAGNFSTQTERSYCPRVFELCAGECSMPVAEWVYTEIGHGPLLLRPSQFAFLNHHIIRQYGTYIYHYLFA